MQIYSRILVNVPVKLTRNYLILVNLRVNLLVKTDQKLNPCRSKGGHGGGLTPSRALLEGCILEPTGFLADPGIEALGVGPKAQGSVGIRAVPLGSAPRPNGPPLCLGRGNTLARRLAGGCSPTIPWCILPDGPPKCSGTVRGSRRASHRFFGLSWETSSHSRVLFT